MAENGLVTLSSKHSVKDTIDRLAAEVTAKGMTYDDYGRALNRPVLCGLL
jgi:uncharacterized protein (DUF302 family)